MNRQAAPIIKLFLKWSKIEIVQGWASVTGKSEYANFGGKKKSFKFWGQWCQFILTTC